jgi:hypothetical protein
LKSSLLKGTGASLSLAGGFCGAAERAVAIDGAGFADGTGPAVGSTGRAATGSSVRGGASVTTFCLPIGASALMNLTCEFGCKSSESLVWRSVWLRGLSTRPI